MALRGARCAGLVAVLALGLAACGGRATAPNDGGPEDGARPDGTLRDGSFPEGGVVACGPYPGGQCQAPAVCDVHGCAPGASGLCVAASGSCNDLYAPVCGCDWMTYPNDCERVKAGVALSYVGACVAPDGGGSCIDDDLEPNDTPQTATNLDGTLVGHPQGVSLYGVEICWAGDVDYYSFTLSASKAATVMVLFTRSQGELSVALLDAGLNPLATSAPVANGLQVQASLSAGTYYLRVAAGPGGTMNKYDFSLTFQ